MKSVSYCINMLWNTDFLLEFQLYLLLKSMDAAMTRIRHEYWKFADKAIIFRIPLRKFIQVSRSYPYCLEILNIWTCNLLNYHKLCILHPTTKSTFQNMPLQPQQENTSSYYICICIRCTLTSWLLRSKWWYLMENNHFKRGLYSIVHFKFKQKVRALWCIGVLN